MLDGGEEETPDDPTIHNRWEIAIIADTFHQLPSVVARAMESDVNDLNSSSCELLEYARVYHAFKRGEEHTEPWKGSVLLSVVNENTFDLKHRQYHPSIQEGCPTCKKMRELRGW